MEHDLRQLTKEVTLLVVGVGVMLLSAKVVDFAAPSLGPDGRTIAHIAGVLGDTYVGLRLVGPNAFAVAEVFVTRATDLLVLLVRSWHRVRNAFRDDEE